MKNKGLLLSAVLATVLFAGNISAVKVTVGSVEVVNKTDGDIWVTFNTFNENCPGGCDYTRIDSGKSKSPVGSVTGKLLNVYAYESTGIKAKKGYNVKGDKVEISVKNKKIVITEKE